MTMLRLGYAMLLLSGLLWSGCNSTDPVIDQGGSNANQGGGGDSVNDIPVAELRKVMTELEQHFNTGLNPHVQVNWRSYYANRGWIVGNVWLNEHELIFEDGRQVVTWLPRVSGRAQEGGFADLDQARATPQRRIATRPARSANYIHVVCNDGVYMVLDAFGNREYQNSLAFAPQCEPAATDNHLLIGGTDRFFYGFDIRNNRYDRRARLDEVAQARPIVAGTNRLFFADNSGGIHCLSLDPSDFFKPVWTKKVIGKVVAPLAANTMLANPQLYVASRDDGVVFGYSTLNGEIEWHCSTEGEITEEMVPDLRYSKDRLYTIVERSNKKGNNGLWCILADDSADKSGDLGAKLWIFPGANKILALGKNHIYVRTGKPGAYKIAVVRTSDGSLESELTVDPRVDIWLTNPYGPALILGAFYRKDTLMFFSVTEPE